ncbi:hypothetical protein SDC9_74441 [bioreactor metagenome]|uniref:Uncharacterized protein n=1 Tax=bioreactor metagenome TaxID=1076179 RepID=A0A644YH70_9ZZZZ
MKKTWKLLLTVTMLLVVVVVAGCGGGSGSNAKRVSGLTPDGVVNTFFESAKAGDLNEAALYVSHDSKQSTQTVKNFLTGELGLDQIKDANLLSVKKVAEKGDYAVVLATLQDKQGSMKVTVKPVGLTKVSSEWYIVDADQIYSDAKYKILQQLLANI